MRRWGRFPIACAPCSGNTKSASPRAIYDYSGIRGNELSFAVLRFRSERGLPEMGSRLRESEQLRVDTAARAEEHLVCHRFCRSKTANVRVAEHHSHGCADWKSCVTPRVGRTPPSAPDPWSGTPTHLKLMPTWASAAVQGDRPTTCPPDAPSPLLSEAKERLFFGQPERLDLATPLAKKLRDLHCGAVPPPISAA